ncbi:MAG: hypothetical protein FJ109_11005 [Deltaproteobacteria bacterium]|nr:hypothetical protein [Deltaproteobacteria bacterium]
MATVERSPCREVSDLTIERYIHNVLEPARKAEVEAHMADCRDCTAKLQQAQALGEKFVAEVLPRTLPAPLRTAPETVRPQAPPSWLSWPRLAMGLGMAAACAVAAVAVVSLAERGTPGTRPRTHGAEGANTATELRSDPGEGTQLRGQGVNEKGSDGWRVYGKRGSDVFLVQPDQELRAGDTLRFVPDVSGAAHLMVVSLEAGGRFNVYYPFGGTRSAQLSTPVGEALPGSIELDSSVGSEMLYLLVSGRPFDVQAARAMIASRMTGGGAGPDADSGLRLPAPDFPHSNSDFRVLSLPIRKVAP